MYVCPAAYLWNYTSNLYQFFCARCLYGRGSVLLQHGDEIPRRRGNFGFSSPLSMHCIAFAANRIIQSPITSCSRRDHSVCPASANRNPENSERRRCGKWVMGVHSADELWSTIPLLDFAWVVDDAKCIVVTRVCVSVCLSAAARLHYCTDPDVTWGLVGDAP